MDTYEQILNRMCERYTTLTDSEPSQESDIMARLRTLAAEVYKYGVYADFIKRQIFPTTAVGEYLDMHAAERGLSRKPAASAVGSVLFFADGDEHSDILIPAGTVVCTGSDMLRFTTDSDAVLPSTSDRVNVAVTAESAGAAYNALGGCVTIIVTPITGIGRVYNIAPFSGGCDDESDDELRARIADSCVNIVTGANAAYYKRIALSVPGVYSASAVSGGSGVVYVYIAAQGDTVSSQIKNQIQSLMDDARPLNVSVSVRDPEEIHVSLCVTIETKPGYSFNTVSARVNSAITGYIESLGIGRDFKLSEIGNIIYGMEGVADYHFLESYGSDRSVSDSQYAVPDQILIREY